ncbi:sigma-70 family RNA polymerase sigma factor [Aureispira sp. CCB-E]|uniref:sigma-70 family RNA polymerase sigma factor n=1 Tax=Aureispira sp. CCB-E TaxID=3051121 RepID=UPI002868D9C4|nr:sigma-70 family RNA polymerase sigma factor [Aureispira sp. CCB-E]WMX16812.1 sigma-70 family RNA polymerase sigma factor [Aureispira sp. CCB-E]
MKESISQKIDVAHWVNTHSDALYRYAYSKTGDRHVAEDLVQEAFLGALQSTKQAGEIQNQKSWLFSILRNKIVDYYRKLERESKQATHGYSEEEMDENAHFIGMGMWRKEARDISWTNTENLITDQEFNAVLDACLTKLPEHYRTVVRLKIMESENTDLICQDLGISNTNLWQIIHRTKLRLRACINKYWFQA